MNHSIGRDLVTLAPSISGKTDFSVCSVEWPNWSPPFSISTSTSGVILRRKIPKYFPYCHRDEKATGKEIAIIGP